MFLALSIHLQLSVNLYNSLEQKGKLIEIRRYAPCNTDIFGAGILMTITSFSSSPMPAGKTMPGTLPCCREKNPRILMTEPKKW
jgi:hypothetical protein